MLLVDGTGNLFADLSTQSRTTRRMVVGTLHAQQMPVHLLGEFSGDEAARRFVGFTPVKRDAEIGAARTAD